jgi:hypothetical protein
VFFSGPYSVTYTCTFVKSHCLADPFPHYIADTAAYCCSY